MNRLVQWFLNAGMNTSRKKRKGKPFRKALRLQSSFTLFVSIALYTLISSYLLSPKILAVTDQQLTFVSTDTSSSTKPSFQHAILQAKKSITLICYSICDSKIIAALKEVAEKDVSVRIIFDLSATPTPLSSFGNKIEVHPRKARGLMHHKLLVIDHNIVWLSTANMTTGSLQQHGNLSLGLKSPPLAQEIESLAEAMITQKTFTSRPLELLHKDQHFRLYLHPFHGKSSLNDLINRIEQAKKKVFVAMYTFTHPLLKDALVRAQKRGVDVRVIFDKESSKRTSQIAFLALKKANVPCAYRTKAGLLHYKTALIDNTLCTGSCNWTKAGFKSNDDFIFIIDPLSSDQLTWIEEWWKSVEQRSSFSRTT